jgi:hypothetical protein
MRDEIYAQLEAFYRQSGIHPLDFRCPHQEFCRSKADPDAGMTEAKMSMLGSQYGEKYPRIVVVSLDPPLGEESPFREPYQRTTTYLLDDHETSDYSKNRPNSHWKMTLITVRSILSLFGYEPKEPNAAIVSESYAGRPIANTTPYFAHVNVAKCSMNYPNKKQAPKRVHQICGESYLKQELVILQPEILVSQGKNANEIVGQLLMGRSVKLDELPVVFELELRQKPFLWLPMHHPTYEGKSKVQDQWPFYEEKIQNWGREQKMGARVNKTLNTPLPDSQIKPA